jgi:Tfp pilus assembly protein PilX
MRTDREQVLMVLLALALVLLAITAFALARAQQRYTAAPWYQG